MKQSLRNFLYWLGCISVVYSWAQNPVTYQTPHLEKQLDSIELVGEEKPQLIFEGLYELDSTILEVDRPLFTVVSHYMKGNAYRYLRDFEKLTYHYEKCKELATKYGYREFHAEIYREMGDEYMMHELYREAEESYKKGQAVYREFGDERGVILCSYKGFMENLRGEYKESNQILIQNLSYYQKAHPVYLNALQVIALNFQAMNNLDSAFAYVNRMPLESIEDRNNFFYGLWRNHISVLYYLEKGDTEKATFHNEEIGKVRFGDEFDAKYLQNRIQIAKQQGDAETALAYTDSLQVYYENRIDKVQKSEIYNTDKYVETSQITKQQQTLIKRRTWLLVIAVGVAMVIILLLYLYFAKKKKQQDAQIEAMRKELQQVTMVNESSKEGEKTTQKLDEKIQELVEQYDLSVRETDVLYYITKGYNNKQIAEELFVSVNTIKYHTRNLYGKLAINKRTEIASKFF